MASIAILDLCAAGCHAMLEITTSKGVVTRQIDFGQMEEARDVEQIADHVLGNLRTAMRLGNTTAETLGALLAGRSFQE